jgi:adenine-specific DNA-methyltransferase
MTEFNNLQNILAEIARDVASKSSRRTAAAAFGAYKRCLEPLAAPYIRDGFLDEHGALARFISETATLHLAVLLISEWCDVHNVGRAEGFWDIYPEARFFSWYEDSTAFSANIRDWVVAHSDIRDMVQAVTLVAENSLAGLRRRALGEFFTPTEVAHHLLALTDYDPLRIPKHRVVDPACGSGNLLAAVVAKNVEAVQSGLLEPATAVSSMNHNTIGFDIQPVAILLTRLQLLLASLPILDRSGLSNKNIYETLPFNWVQLRDPLSNPEDLWDLFASFDIVLGNPPFLKAAKDRLPFVGKYEDVLAGHINLYQLFLWWAIRAARTGGRVSFLVPQSMRSGQYFSKLRQAITDTCELVALTRFVDRTGVFDSVDQPMMIVVLEKLAKRSQKSNIAVRVSANGQLLDRLPALNVSQGQVIWTQEDRSVWCISNESIDYAILTKVCEGHPSLGKANGLKILNGGFVWNQHKGRLKPTEDDNTLPLLSSASIGIHQFTFPPSDKRVAQRLFVDITPPLTKPVHANPAILLKRTTPKKMRGRRVVAATLPDGFLAKYPAYLAENHVNLIRAADSSVPKHLLSGLCAWLNSRLVNFVFGMMNGSSHLSKFELELIPTPILLLEELSDLINNLLASPIEKRRAVLEQIDNHIFEFFGLSPKEIQQVTQVIPSAV